MKNFYLFLGIGEIIFALIAFFVAVTSRNQNAWFGYFIAVAFGLKGLIYINYNGKN